MSSLTFFKVESAQRSIDHRGIDCPEIKTGCIYLYIIYTSDVLHVGVAW